MILKLDARLPDAVLGEKADVAGEDDAAPE